MNATPVTLADLPDEAARRKERGWRLVTVTCVPVPDGNLDLLYHFDRDLVLEHLRLTVERGAEVPSLTPVHPGAYLVENEIQDQFGLRFAGLAPDFQGGLMLEPEVRLSPLAAYTATPPPAAPPVPTKEGE